MTMGKYKYLYLEFRFNFGKCPQNISFPSRVLIRNRTPADFERGFTFNLKTERSLRTLMFMVIRYFVLSKR